jgi:hypothetical protein
MVTKLAAVRMIGFARIRSSESLDAWWGVESPGLAAGRAGDAFDKDHMTISDRVLQHEK